MPPSLGLLALEPIRGLFDWCASYVAAIAPAPGDGHAVIVYPGLGAGAAATARLRDGLTAAGYAAHDWGRGRNAGPTGDPDVWLGGLEEQVLDLHERTGRRVSLIGWSLGGIYARELAKRVPTRVRQVITLGTPFAALPDSTHAARLYRVLNGDAPALTARLLRRLRQTPPVPTTSIYSKTDGVVPWQGCLQPRGRMSENIEISVASHLGLANHPAVMRVVTDRLALPEGGWRPYAALA
jgi:alpha-beta hydrolase superfamily lysophospholipase